MSIVLDRLSKRFGPQVVLDRVSLEVKDQELFVLLGASGSGKSTILRIIAGLLQADTGRVQLNGRDVTNLPPQKRGTGFVFQNYSIFRHMTVADNVEFGLKIRKVGAAERARRRDELLDMVGLMGFGNRYAGQLSGGQLQRVALARALAYEPSVLLLDEPFGALDVKIRAQLRRSLKEIQRRLGVPTILVTHDQDEAFELADRIGLVDRGRLLEVGEPETLYHQPRSLAVATFLGAGTVLAARAQNGHVQFGDAQLPVPAELPHEDGGWVAMLVRPEQVTLHNGRATPGADLAQTPSQTLGQGTIAEQTFSGAVRRVRVRLPRLRGARQLAPVGAFGEEGHLVDALLPAGAPLPSGKVQVGFQGWHLLAAPPARVLVYDSTAAEPSPLTLASALATRLRAGVTVLGVTDDADRVETLRAGLEQRCQQLGLANAEVKVRQGNEIEQIAAEQREGFYELLVLATTGAARASSPYPFPPSALALAAMKQPAIPVLLARGASIAEPNLQNLLICTAAGEPGKSDVRVGGWLARRLGAAANLLYVTRGGAEPPAWVRHHFEQAVASLHALDVPAEVRYRPAASPADGIVAEAQEGYGMVVVGAHGPQSRSALARDDVTLQVLARSATPVLVVPADE